MVISGLSMVASGKPATAAGVLKEQSHPNTETCTTGTAGGRPRPMSAPTSRTRSTATPLLCHSETSDARIVHELLSGRTTATQLLCSEASDGVVSAPRVICHKTRPQSASAARPRRERASATKGGTNTWQHAGRTRQTNGRSASCIVGKRSGFKKTDCAKHI